jgi:hypothetical protein
MIRGSANDRHCEPRALRVAKQSLLFLGAFLLSSATAHACSVCGGDPSSPMTAGMNSAIWALLAITGTVVSSVLGFFLFLWRRARTTKRAAIDTAWLDGLRGVTND